MKNFGAILALALGILLSGNIAFGQFAGGVYSVGTASVSGEIANFATLKAACDAINAGASISGDVTLYITSDLTEAANVGLGVNTSGFQIQIRPDADADRTITFGQTTDNAGPSGGFSIGISNPVANWTSLVTTDNVTVDGYAVSGSTRRLIWKSAATAHAATGPLSVVGNSNNVTFKNCIVRHQAAASASTSTNYYAVSAKLRNATSDYVPDNITIENNDITISSVATGNAIGMAISGASSATMTGTIIKNNIITARNRGIFLTNTAGAEIYGNQISLNQTTTGYASSGIAGNSGNSGTFNIYKNKLIQLQTATTTGAGNGIRGIQASGGGTYNIYNNFISGFVTPASGTAEVVGIRVGVASNIYYNTIVIDNVSNTGPGTTPTAGIVAYTTACDIRNNIIITNEDDFTSYCIYASSLPATSNYNNLYRAGTTNAKIGYYTAAQADLGAWQTASGKDANSKSVAVTFAGAPDLHLAGGSLGNTNLIGVTGLGITTDIDGETRSVSYPYTGADENLSAPLPVELTSFTAASRGKNVELTWSTGTETNNAGFSVERKAVGADWQTVTFIKGQGTSNKPASYSYTDNVAAGRYIYRLKQVDQNGVFKYTSSVEAIVESAPIVFGLMQNYPNPFNPTTMIRFAVATAQKVTLRIYNTAGQEVASLFEGTANAGAMYEVPFNAGSLASGMYFSVLQTATSREVKKMTLLR